MVITEPVPDVIAALGWTGGECITNSRALIHYFRTTPDGRIAFGWGGGRVVPGARLNGRAELDRSLVAELERHLVRFFPALAGRRIEHAWGGPIDVSPMHLPVLGSSTAPGPLRVRLHRQRRRALHGSRGVAGVAWRSIGATRLHRLPIVDSPSVRVPPEPLRYAGGTMVRAALLRTRAPRGGRQATGALTRAISGLPARIGIHIGR